MFAAILIATVFFTAGVRDRLWHHALCVSSVRNARLVTFGSGEFGIAEYSWRHVLPGGSTPAPDPRDVKLHLGTLGRFPLSRILLWCAALCAGAGTARLTARERGLQ